MTRTEMWKEIVLLGEWGIKDEFMQIADEELRNMTVGECLDKCYMMMFHVDNV